MQNLTAEEFEMILEESIIDDFMSLANRQETKLVFLNELINDTTSCREVKKYEHLTFRKQICYI